MGGGHTGAEVEVRPVGHIMHVHAGLRHIPAAFETPTMHALDQLLNTDEPDATFQDAIVIAIHTDYAKRRFVADLEVRVDGRSGEDGGGPRRRRGQLVVENLRLWALEPPDRTHRAPKGLLLTQAGPLADAPTEAGAMLSITVGVSGVSWYLFFDDLKAFAYLAGDRASFTWA